MTTAAELRWRFRFERRALDDDGARLGDWGADAFTVWAKTVYVHGSEDVLQGRLQGRQPIVITVRKSARSSRLDNTWRAVDVRTGAIFNVGSVEATRGEERAFIDVLGQSDGSDGGP